jgi:toxin ParE1/3/4
VTFRLRLRQVAVSDIAEARSWYEAQQSGLGQRFLEAIDAAFERIQSRPLAFPIVQRDARRALVGRFPYSIYFRLRGDEIRVLAVVHQSRHPKHWRRRISQS